MSCDAHVHRHQTEQRRCSRLRRKLASTFKQSGIGSQPDAADARCIARAALAGAALILPLWLRHVDGGRSPAAARQTESAFASAAGDGLPLSTVRKQAAGDVGSTAAAALAAALSATWQHASTQNAAQATERRPTVASTPGHSERSGAAAMRSAGALAGMPQRQHFEVCVQVRMPYTYAGYRAYTYVLHRHR